MSVSVLKIKPRFTAPVSSEDQVKECLRFLNKVLLPAIDRSGVSDTVIKNRSGVTTLPNWRAGKTKSPGLRTMLFVLKAAGYDGLEVV